MSAKSDALRTLVGKLRQKIERDQSQPKLLISESGVGYRLERHFAGGGAGGRKVLDD